MVLQNIVALLGIILPSVFFGENISNQVATGPGVELVITPYTTTFFSDGKDKVEIMVRVVDVAGADVQGVESVLRIKVQGNGSIVSDIGKSTGKQEVKKVQEGVWETKLSNGVCWFYLVAGNTPDKIKVEVNSEGLKSASSEIHSIIPFKLLKPLKSQLKPSDKVIGKMIGADISHLPSLESRGMKFSDNGVQKDAIEILKDHGFNYIRLRLFNNPAAEKGYSPKIGFCDLEHTLQMAKRIKNSGMKILIDFHYSDYWTDPQQQNKPSAWQGLEKEKLEDALRSYTREVISALKSQGTTPDMVQIGNEINHGMVWPDGHIGNPDELARLIKAGVAGVKDVDPSVIIMLHIALGGQNAESVFWLDNMIARGVEFDLIGLSYYPRWHGTLSDLKNNMINLISRYHKDINLVEYSQVKEEVNDIVFNLPDKRGNGTCIWEPLSTWERIFDREGKSNELIKKYDIIAGRYLR